MIAVLTELEHEILMMLSGASLGRNGRNALRQPLRVVFLLCTISDHLSGRDYDPSQSTVIRPILCLNHMSLWHVLVDELHVAVVARRRVVRRVVVRQAVYRACRAYRRQVVLVLAEHRYRVMSVAAMAYIFSTLHFISINDTDTS